MMRPIFLAAALAVFALGASAQGHHHHGAPAAKGKKASAETPFGRAADAKKAKRTIQVEMTDQMRFTPAEITVRQGEIVRFVPANKGKVMHEMVLGTMDELKKHAEMMRKNPKMAHDEPWMAHVRPGRSGEIGWEFTQPGEFFYACLVPGHFEAGMIGKVIVQAAVAATLTDAEVKNIDKKMGRITLEHAPMPHLNMPGMTMAFQVQDPALLDKVKPGDKVKFDAEKRGVGYTITKIDPAR